MCVCSLFYFSLLIATMSVEKLYQLTLISKVENFI